MHISGEGFMFTTSPSTDAAIDSIVDLRIEADEEGTDTADQENAATVIARASLRLDLASRTLNPGLDPKSVTSGVYIGSALRILITRCMDAHLCQCPRRSDNHTHEHGTPFGPCGGHTRTLDEPRLCADCA